MYKYKTEIQAAQSSCYKCGGSEYQIRRCMSNKTDKTVHQSNCERNFTEPLIKVVPDEPGVEQIDETLMNLDLYCPCELPRSIREQVSF